MITIDTIIESKKQYIIDHVMPSDLDSSDVKEGLKKKEALLRTIDGEYIRSSYPNIDEIIDYLNDNNISEEDYLNFLNNKDSELVVDNTPDIPTRLIQYCIDNGQLLNYEKLERIQIEGLSRESDEERKVYILLSLQGKYLEKYWSRNVFWSIIPDESSVINAKPDLPAFVRLSWLGYVQPCANRDELIVINYIRTEVIYDSLIDLKSKLDLIDSSISLEKIQFWVDKDLILEKQETNSEALTEDDIEPLYLINKDDLSTINYIRNRISYTDISDLKYQLDELEFDVSLSTLISWAQSQYINETQTDSSQILYTLTLKNGSFVKDIVYNKIYVFYKNTWTKLPDCFSILDSDIGSKYLSIYNIVFGNEQVPTISSDEGTTEDGGCEYCLTNMMSNTLYENNDFADNIYFEINKNKKHCSQQKSCSKSPSCTADKDDDDITDADTFGDPDHCEDRGELDVAIGGYPGLNTEAVFKIMMDMMGRLLKPIWKFMGKLQCQISATMKAIIDASIGIDLDAILDLMASLDAIAEVALSALAAVDLSFLPKIKIDLGLGFAAKLSANIRASVELICREIQCLINNAISVLHGFINATISNVMTLAMSQVNIVNSLVGTNIQIYIDNGSISAEVGMSLQLELEASLNALIDESNSEALEESRSILKNMYQKIVDTKLAQPNDPDGLAQLKDASEEALSIAQEACQQSANLLSGKFLSSSKNIFHNIFDALSYSFKNTLNAIRNQVQITADFIANSARVAAQAAVLPVTVATEIVTLTTNVVAIGLEELNGVIASNVLLSNTELEDKLFGSLVVSSGALTEYASKANEAINEAMLKTRNFAKENTIGLVDKVGQTFKETVGTIFDAVVTKPVTTAIDSVTEFAHDTFDIGFSLVEAGKISSDFVNIGIKQLNSDLDNIYEINKNVTLSIGQSMIDQLVNDVVTLSSKILTDTDMSQQSSVSLPSDESYTQRLNTTCSNMQTALTSQSSTYSNILNDDANRKIDKFKDILLDASEDTVYIEKDSNLINKVDFISDKLTNNVIDMSIEVSNKINSLVNKINDTNYISNKLLDRIDKLSESITKISDMYSVINQTINDENGKINNWTMDNIKEIYNISQIYSDYINNDTVNSISQLYNELRNTLRIPPSLISDISYISALIVNNTNISSSFYDQVQETVTLIINGYLVNDEIDNHISVLNDLSEVESGMFNELSKYCKKIKETSTTIRILTDEYKSKFETLRTKINDNIIHISDNMNSKIDDIYNRINTDLM